MVNVSPGECNHLRVNIGRSEYVLSLGIKNKSYISLQNDFKLESEEITNVVDFFIS